MMAKAVEQRWPMSDGIRRGIIARLIQVMASKDSSPREITAAARALMSAEKQNQEDEHKVVDVVISERNHRLDAIAADLGIDQSLIESVARETGSGDGGDAGSTTDATGDI